MLHFSTWAHVSVCDVIWRKNIIWEYLGPLPATFLLTVCTKKVRLLLAIWIYLLFVTWKSWLEKFFFYFWCILYIGTYMLYNQKRNWGFFYFGHIFFDNDNFFCRKKNLYIWQMLCNFTKKTQQIFLFFTKIEQHTMSCQY